MSLRIPPLVYLLIFGILAIVVDAYSPFDILIGEGRLAVSAAFATFGGIVMVLGIMEFRRHRTTVNPLSPENANALVQSGIYRFTRNPMYLGMLAMLFGLVIFTQDALALLAVIGFVTAMNRFQIRVEERALREMFGDVYVRYCDRTRRWV